MESSPRHPERHHLFATIWLICSGIIVALVGAEIAYRVKLGFAQMQSVPPTYHVMSGSIYQYDRAFGYAYVPNMQATAALVVQGYPAKCEKVRINSRGEFGRDAAVEPESSVKILVFGDSFTAFPVNGLTWADLLQDELTAKLGRAVSVSGLGRDGYGVLQMFDLAAAIVDAHKPDLILLAFISDDLTRARFWKSVKTIDGQLRLFVSTDPSGEADPARSVDALMIDPRVTLAWCESMASSRHPDNPLLQALNTRYGKMQREYMASANVLSPFRSLLYNRLVHRDPYYGSTPLRSRPELRIALDDLTADAQFSAAVAKLTRSGVPFHLVHLPTYEEVKAKKYILRTQQDERLLESLYRATNKHALGLLDNEADDQGQPEALFRLPHDYHPSAKGNTFYARAVAQGLIDQGVGAIGRAVRDTGPSVERSSTAPPH